MSRFFANVEEEEEEIKSDMEKIEEEKEEPAEESKAKKKKKKKKKGVVAPPPEVEEEKDDEKEAKGKKKKKKKNKNISSVVQKKMEEKRKLEAEQRAEAREKFFLFVTDFHKLIYEDLGEFSKRYNKRIENKKKKALNKPLSKKERERKLRGELMRQQFEKNNLNVQQQLNVDGTVTKPKRKKKNKRKKSEQVQLVEETAEKEEDVVDKEKEAQTKKEELQKELAEEDDWENMLDSNDEKSESEPEPEPVKEEPKPKPKKAKKKEPEPTVNKELLEAENFNNPLSFFNIKSKYRCPIICIMGHVDTGKTKILDHIRKTNVQGGEAGGITQQIGASYFPAYKLKEEVEKLDKKVLPVEVELPGYLVIDTPGHESFANLRSRGSSLCDFAIVVIDIMHALENQTIESLNMLIKRGTPFVIALNKIDRLFKWKTFPDQSSYKSLLKQEKFVKNVFNEQLLPVLAGLGKLSINAQLYWENTDPLEYVPIVPTSAITGEGMPDLLGYIAYYTQTYLPKQITKNLVDFKATVLEVKKIEGMGATVDIILVNGVLNVDDKIVLSGFAGPIKTTIKALLTPHPMKEMRVKNEYLHHKRVEGSIGIKIMAQGLEEALAGTSIYKYETEEEYNEYCAYLKDDIKKVKKSIKLKKEGVGVAASTLGSLEALLAYLKQMKIPVSTVCIGDVSKNDLFKIMAPFQTDDEENRCKKKEFMTLLAFDVKLLADATKYAEENKLKVIQANIIYHLFDGFTKHVEVIKEERKKEEGKKAVFPCIIKQVACFRKKDPIILGIEVERGVLKPKTPVCIFNKERLKLGYIETIELNNKSIKEARKKTGSVAIRIKSPGSILHGRHFTEEDKIVSILSRESIDVLKLYFRDEMETNDWELIRKLKPFFDIN